MLKKDYMMRLIDDFVAALQRLLEKDDSADRRAELRQLYETYVGPYELYHHCTLEEMVQALAGEDEEHRWAKMQMLSELYDREAELESEPMATALRQKALFLYDSLERQGNTYSMARHERMAILQRQLKPAEAVTPKANSDKNKRQ